MEGFSRIDIFDTKGIEYIFVIGYLLILIFFWKISGRQIRLVRQAQEVIGNLSATILKIPQGLFYNKNHTWTHLDDSGVARVGLDDFLQHVTGEVQFENFKGEGETVNKGDLLTEIYQDNKRLKIFSPISGEVMHLNEELKSNPEIVNEDPYREGWMYEIKPSRWKAETNSFYLAEEATNWATKELERFKDFLTGGSMQKYSSRPSVVMLQEGGELRDNILADLPGEVWQGFQKEFMSI